MPRYIVTGTKIDPPTAPKWCYYITRRGCLTTSGEKAGPVESLTEALKELEYWRREYRDYRWSLEKLPPRLPMKTATLRAELLDY